MVHNHARLVRRFELSPETDCDSEVLGLLLARFAGSLSERAARTASVACGPLAMLGLWRNPTRLLVVRRAKPLHFCETARGFYFASVPFGMPSRAASIADNYAGVVVFERGGLRLDARPIEQMVQA